MSEPWSTLAAITTVVQGVAVTISLVGLLLIWLQLKQNVKLTKAANVQHLAELSSSFPLQLIQDPQVAALWLEGAKGGMVWVMLNNFAIII